MKKIFIILGGIFLVIIIAFIGMGLFTWYRSSQYAEVAIPYIEKTVPEISKWDAEQIKTYMAPEVLAETPDEDFRKIIKYLSKLGPLISLGEPKFTKIYSGANLDHGKQIIVTYVIGAVYEKGDATITISLLDKGESFQIYHFHIDSLAMAE